MHEADIDEGHPRQRRRDQQQRGGHDFSGARPHGRRLDRTVIVVAVVIMTMPVIIVRMGMGVGIMPVGMIHLVAARVAAMCANERDRACDQMRR